MTTSTGKQLYFIALVLPKEGARQVTAIKEYFRDHFGSKAAMRSPPHITLHMPFSWPDKRLEQLKGFLKTFAQNQDSISITLQNFQAFPPRVIYIDVLHHPQLLRLQESLLAKAKSELKLFNANYKDRPFVPHVTVAFRDLKKASFHMAWESFTQQEFHYQFLAKNISLLRHDGKAWQEVNYFPFVTI